MLIKKLNVELHSEVTFSVMPPPPSYLKCPGLPCPAFSLLLSMVLIEPGDAVPHLSSRSVGALEEQGAQFITTAGSGPRTMPSIWWQQINEPL